MSIIESAAVETAWQSACRIPESRIPIEMGKAGRAQPELLAFILGSTEGMGPGVSELAGFIYFVIWRAFRAEQPGRVRPVTAGAIQRALERNEEELMSIDGMDPQQIDEAAIARLTRQPALFRYVIEAISEAEEDENQPVSMSPEEKGSIILLLKTAIDALDEAEERGL